METIIEVVDPIKESLAICLRAGHIPERCAYYQAVLQQTKDQNPIMPQKAA